MMYKTTMTLLLSAAFASSAAWAQDTSASATVQTDNTSGTTQATAEEVTHGYLRNEIVGIRPELGVLVFKDALDNTTSRGAAGLELEANMVSSINRAWENVFLGPSTGVIYSHLGAPGSNFFGSGPSIAGSASGSGGANFLLIPVDGKLGYTFGDNFRVAAHGGGNVTYRSVASSLNFGASSAQAGSVWSIYPNVGADVEFGLGPNIALSLRPDVTFTPGNDLFAGMVSLGIPIG